MNELDENDRSNIPWNLDLKPIDPTKNLISKRIFPQFLLTTLKVIFGPADVFNGKEHPAESGDF